MTKVRKTLSAAHLVETFAAGLCLTLVAASVLMAVEAQAAPNPHPPIEAAPVAAR